MSNLPQETRAKIISEARKYATEKEANNDYVDNALCSYADGATEWAVKAQGPISTLELLSVWLNECKEHCKLLDVNKAISAIENALAKYKEVSNGKEIGDSANIPR